MNVYCHLCIYAPWRLLWTLFVYYLDNSRERVSPSMPMHLCTTTTLDYYNVLFGLLCGAEEEKATGFMGSGLLAVNCRGSGLKSP